MTLCTSQPFVATLTQADLPTCHGCGGLLRCTCPTLSLVTRLATGVCGLLVGAGLLCLIHWGGLW
jgi:hypothetical protein